MKIKITEHRNYNNSIKTIDLLKVKENITKEFNRIGKKLVDDSKQNMLRGKTGIKYSRLPNRSSARGEGLASQSGETRDSIKHKVATGKYMDFGGNTDQLAIWEGDSNNKYNNRPTLLKSVKKFDSILAGRLKR